MHLYACKEKKRVTEKKQQNIKFNTYWFVQTNIHI